MKVNQSKFLIFKGSTDIILGGPKSDSSFDEGQKTEIRDDSRNKYFKDAYSEPRQTSKMELFAKIVNNFQPFKLHLRRLTGF